MTAVDYTRELRAIAARKRRADEQAARITAERDDLIRAAIADGGLTYAEIAAEVGLSAGRISQMGGHPQRGPGRPRKTPT